MMPINLTPLLSREKKQITGYGEGSFTVNEEEVHHGSVLVCGSNVWPWHPSDELSADDFAPIFTMEVPVELLIIGSGTHMKPLPEMLKRYFRENHIAVEVMDTGAACRTYNVCLSESREVAAALTAL